MSVTELSVDEIREGYARGDMDIINGVLGGNIKSKPESPEPAIEENDDVGSDASPDSVDHPGGTPEKPREIQDKVEEPNVEESEVEKLRKLVQLREEQSREERERYLQEKRDRETQLAQEKKVREDVEKQLQELQKRITNTPKPSTETEKSDDDDDVYVSDYSKETRKIVEDIRSSFDTNNPVFKELSERLDKFEKNETERLREIEAAKRKEEEERSRRKLYRDAEELFLEYPELKPNKKVEQLQSDWVQFRKDIAFVSNSKNEYELETAIQDYFTGGKTKEVADQKGVVPMEDFDKFKILVNLVDLKNGIEYDPKTGKEIPILDDSGNRVRYRSLSEAYKISNFFNELNNTRIKSFQEVQSKLSERQNSPRVLQNENLEDHANVKDTQLKDLELIRLHPKQYVNNKELLQKVKDAYARRGIEMPTYRGRKL